MTSVSYGSSDINIYYTASVLGLMSKICSRGIVCQGFGEENKAGMQTIGYNKMSRQVRVNNLDLSLSFL